MDVTEPSRDRSDVTPATIAGLTITGLAALGALFAWFHSLGLPAYIGYDQRDHVLITGINVFLLGWGHPAWWGNVFFALALVVLAFTRGPVAFILAAIGVALSSMSFQLKALPERAFVFGLGTGAFVWMIALQLALLASAAKIGARALSWRSALLHYSPALLVLGGMAAFIYGVQDRGRHQRSIAGTEDTARFGNDTVIKLRPVCQVEQPEGKPIGLGRGPVKLEGVIGPYGSHSAILASPLALLDRGVPAVHYGEGEIGFTDRTGSVLFARRARGEAVALVTLLRTPVGTDVHDVGIRISGSGDERQTRQFTWKVENGDQYCPSLDLPGHTSRPVPDRIRSLDRYVLGDGPRAE